MPIIDFWQHHQGRGYHQADVVHLQDALHIEMNGGDEEAWPPAALHPGLYPQPFIGNVRGASVYILLGNPGASAQDYLDEANETPYADQCQANLLGQVFGFSPLLAPAAGTAANAYWEPVLQPLIDGLRANNPGLTLEAARTQISNRLAVIEALPYHSRRTPAARLDACPSAHPSSTPEAPFLT